MGNYRFRLSDMIPNAWYHKLKSMRGTATATAAGWRRAKMQSGGGKFGKKAHTPSGANDTGAAKKPLFHSQTLVKPGRASYYIPSRGEDGFAATPKYLVDPPRKSKKNHRVGRCVIKPSPNVATSSTSPACACRPTTTEDSGRKHDEGGDGGMHDDLGGLPYLLEKTVVASSNYGTASSAVDVNVDDVKGRTPEKTIQELDLPPILTKPTKREAWSVPKSVQKSPARRRSSSAGVRGLRIRTNTPRLSSSNKLPAHRWGKAPTPRRGLAGRSFAVVKSSSNPQRDFRESMMEMIVANDIRASAELEELLACYLSLNPTEYHAVIVKVFRQIWYDVTNIKS